MPTWCPQKQFYWSVVNSIANCYTIDKHTIWQVSIIAFIRLSATRTLVSTDFLDHTLKAISFLLNWSSDATQTWFQIWAAFPSASSSVTWTIEFSTTSATSSCCVSINSRSLCDVKKLSTTFNSTCNTLCYTKCSDYKLGELSYTGYR